MKFLEINIFFFFWISLCFREDMGIKEVSFFGICVMYIVVVYGGYLL